MFSTKALFASTLIAAASAHQNFHQFWVNDVTPGYQVGIRMPPSNSPVTDVTSNDIACNVNGEKGVADTVAAAEGDTIKVQWDQSGHPGPITHFLFGPVDDASAATGVGSWFKIDELDYVDGKWANEIMGAQNMTHEFKLPAGLASGEYLLRSEMLALHGAQTIGGAQFYIGCAQLKITGTSSGSCGPTIDLPGAYKAEDDNIYIPNVYNGFDATTYSAPGGPVASCGAGSGTPSKPANATGSSTTAPLTSSVVAPVSTSAVESIPSSSVAIGETSSSVVAVPAPSSVPAAAQPAASSTKGSSIAALPSTLVTAVRPSSIAASPTGGASGTVQKYGQCGGQGYTGATACAVGSTCKVQNTWYSQCV